MKTLLVFFFLVFSGLNLLGQDSYRLKRVVVRYDHGEKNIREMYYVIRPPLYFTFRPQERTRHGLYQSFLFNGNISEKREYKLGEIIWYQRFDHQGNTIEEYADSTRIKVQREFINNRLLALRQFNNGLKHGLWITNSRNFLRNETKEYDNGELVSAVLREYSEYEKYEFISISVVKTTNLITGEIDYITDARQEKALVAPYELRIIGENVKICAEITTQEDCSYSYILLNPIGPETEKMAREVFDEFITVMPDFKKRHGIKCENKILPLCIYYFAH